MNFVPNALTIGRIVVTPILLALLLTETLLGQVGALVLFLLAAISDYYDGKMARTYGAQSRLGQFLDPFADKVLVLGTLAVLAVMIPKIVPWWAVALIALRDVAVTMLRMWAESRGQSLRTVPMAKTKTTLQLVFLIGVLVVMAATKFPEMIASPARWVLEGEGYVIPLALLMAVVALTIFTGVWYLFNKEYVSPEQVPDEGNL